MVENSDQPTGLEVLEQTLRSVARGRTGAVTGTERMRAALALVDLLRQDTATMNRLLRIHSIVNGTDQ